MYEPASVLEVVMVVRPGWPRKPEKSVMVRRIEDASASFSSLSDGGDRGVSAGRAAAQVLLRLPRGMQPHVGLAAGEWVKAARGTGLMPLVEWTDNLALSWGILRGRSDGVRRRVGANRRVPAVHARAGYGE
jgi:hypothetical protein